MAAILFRYLEADGRDAPASKDCRALEKKNIYIRRRRRRRKNSRWNTVCVYLASSLTHLLTFPLSPREKEKDSYRKSRTVATVFELRTLYTMASIP